MTAPIHGVLQKDDNGYPVAGGVSSTNPVLVLNARIDPVTGRLLVDSASGGGTGTWYTVSGAINGTNPTFTLPITPTGDFVLVLGGQTQIPTKWYTVSGNTITYNAGFIPTGIPTDEHVAFVVS